MSTLATQYAFWVLLVFNGHTAVDGTSWAFQTFNSQQTCESVAKFINEHRGENHAWCVPQ